MPTPLDLSALITDAQTNRKPVPLDHARQALGDLFEECELANETMVIRGADFALTPTAWMRLVRQAQAKQNREEP